MALDLTSRPSSTPSVRPNGCCDRADGTMPSTIANPRSRSRLWFLLGHLVASKDWRLDPCWGIVSRLVVLGSATLVHRVFPLPHLVSHGLGLGGLARHAAPLSLSSAILQVNQSSSRPSRPGSSLAVGGALRYGNSIVRLPFGAIRPAYRTAIYPTLVEASREQSDGGLGATTDASSATASCSSCPWPG